jgi:hypothetical protein
MMVKAAAVKATMETAVAVRALQAVRAELFLAEAQEDLQVQVHQQLLRAQICLVHHLEQVVQAIHLRRTHLAHRV